MTARTHDAFAFASLITVATLYPPTSLNLLTLFAGIVANNIGALIPDMDQAGNRLWDLLPLGDHLAKVFKRIFYKHRTLSHSIIGVFLIYNFLGWVLPKFLNPSFIDPQIVLISIMIGYISHLLADMLTKEGLPLFFPFPFEIGIPPIKTLRIKTGTWLENFIVYPVIWVFSALFIYYNQETLKLILKLVSA